VYWRSSAEMIIPNSLWESTKSLDQQIFDAISLEDMRNMMKQSFADNNLVEPFSLFTNFSYKESNNFEDKISLDILLTKVAVNMSSNIIEDMNTFREHAATIMIMRELKNYRPLQRPIVSEPKATDSNKFKRKRLLIVRDWFFYAVWTTRVKQAIGSLYDNEAKPRAARNEIERLYEQLLERRKHIKKWDKTDPDVIEDALKLLRSKMSNDNEKEEEKSVDIQITIRCQNLSLGMFSEESMAKSTRKPLIEFKFSVTFLNDLNRTLAFT